MLTHVPEAKRIAQARIRLMLSQPFFGSLAMRLTPVETTQIPTFGVDGKNLYFNPDYSATLPFPKLLGVIVHEILHCALNHMLRLGRRDHRIFNIAADYAINPLVIEAGFELPEGGLIDPQYANMSAEEIYSRLIAAQSEPDEPDFPGQASQRPSNPGPLDIGGTGSFQPPTTETGKPLPKAEAEALARDWQVAVAQAVMVAAKAGNLPGQLVALFKQQNAPVVDWRQQLWRFIASATRQDYQWVPPNRRHIANGLYLPSLVNDGLGEIVFAVDTSVSMSRRMLQCAVDELNAVLADAQPERVHVFYCDTEVRKVQEFGPDDYPIEVKAQGGGGTKFAPVFAEVAERDLEPACLIYFTDLQCRAQHFGDEPNYPVLWAATKDGSPPFGEVIKVLIDDA
jgi:predicted metal-dependent peptidase